jgi:transketolase
MQIPIPFLQHVAYKLRCASLELPTRAGSGHASSCLSAVDVVTTLFWAVMRYDPTYFEHPNADRFILSKGHASALLYAVWKELGMISEQELSTYRQFTSRLEGHPTARFPYTQAATGSLGIGLSIGAGHALMARKERRPTRIYVLMGDAELSEGCIWEAAQFASYYKLNNLIGIVDCNGLGQSTQTIGHDTTEIYAQRFAAFGFTVIDVNGHAIPELLTAFDRAQQMYTPVVILARTLKGYGVAMIENKPGWHGKPIPKEQLSVAQEQLRIRFSHAATYTEQYQWNPHLPPAFPIKNNDIPKLKLLPDPAYKKGDQVATRTAYGDALTALGASYPALIALDADVKNSTGAETFESKYPDRLIECFVAEQNMVSVGVGMARCGALPFIATFGAFFTRAHDQIRMAAIGTSPLRLVGSHAGISIGQDGPSQMALEDIALMRTLPDSIVLYPSDAMSTYRLTACMADYADGISYLRTTRMPTPVIYAPETRFVIGGCQVLYEYPNAHASVIAAGITVHEAQQAHDILKKQHNILISVIDLYSIKPLDYTTILHVVQASNGRIITVEDHYIQGGIGEAICSALAHTSINITMLGVTALPRSGSPQELLAWAGIDAQSIVAKILQFSKN